MANKVRPSKVASVKIRRNVGLVYGHVTIFWLLGPQESLDQALSSLRVV